MITAVAFQSLHISYNFFVNGIFITVYSSVICFSTKATVELYSLNLAESGQDMELAGSLEVDSR